jgi:hypothetical protein
MSSCVSVPVATGTRRFWCPCFFCGKQAREKLPNGPHKGRMVCGAFLCGKRQILNAYFETQRDEVT